jgi:hypothetical protein
MDEQRSTYIVIQQERQGDPKEIHTDALDIGSARESELWLNHSSVSSNHAGIVEIEGRFYITDRTPSSSTTLNGRIIVSGESEALKDNDVIQIGPFFLQVRQINGALEIRVSPQPGFPLPDTQEIHDEQSIESVQDATALSTASPEVASALKLFWEKRARNKIAPTTLLNPRSQRPVGKARYHWEATSDLVRPWPISIFIWSLLFIGILLWALSRWYPAGFSPGTVSAAHARTRLTDKLNIARQPDQGACLTCHTSAESINDNCNSCHQAEEFKATVTPPHRAHQVGCVTCHEEHRGADFNPRLAALKTCTECHDDRNVYKGVRMKTPHPETGFGYPVIDGQWKWRGLDDEELASKPPKIRAEFDKWNDSNNQRKPLSENEKRKAQFHALHVYNVRSVGVMPGDEEGKMKCTSCHSFAGVNADTETPRTRCHFCHSGKFDARTQSVLIEPGKPNCTSCHIQHVKDKYLWSSSLVDE